MKRGRPSNRTLPDFKATRKYDPTDILLEVANYYDLSITKIAGPSRLNEIVRARHMYMFLAAAHTSDSYSQIGRLIGRHHASVIHAIKKIGDYSEIAGYPEHTDLISIENRLHVERSTHPVVASFNSLGRAFSLDKFSVDCAIKNLGRDAANN